MITFECCINIVHSFSHVNAAVDAKIKSHLFLFQLALLLLQLCFLKFCKNVNHRNCLQLLKLICGVSL